MTELSALEQPELNPLTLKTEHSLYRQLNVNQTEILGLSRCSSHFGRVLLEALFSTVGPRSADGPS